MGVAAACEPADCTTHFMSASPSGFWNDPSSWDTGAVPTDSDIACIGAGWNVQLPGGGEVTVKGLKTASTLFLIQTSLTILNPQIQGAATGNFFLGSGSSITIGGGTGNLTLDGGGLAGSGDVYGSVSGASSVSPGEPGDTGVGVLTVHGNLALDATTVPIDLSGNGAVAGVGHDRLAVTGAFSATANTTFDLLPGPTFVPVAHTTMSPVTASSESGVPATVIVPDLPGAGKALAVSYAGVGLDLYVTDCDPAAYGPYADYTTSLAGKDLRLCPLYGSSFTGVNLTGTDLAEAILWDASFGSADLTGANLARAEVGGADLSTATLTGLRSGATQGVPLLPTGWSAIGGYLVGPGADLAGVDLSGLTLTGVSLAGAKLTGANLSGLDLTGINLTGAVLTGANLTGTKLTGAALAGVRSGGVVGTPASLPASWQLRSGFLAGPRADFTGANLAGVDLSGTILSAADFSGANLTGTNLFAELSRARSGAIVGTPSALPPSWQIRGGFLVGPTADLSGRTLTGTNLTNVDLTDATFAGATLVGVVVTGSKWNRVDVVGIKGKSLSGLPTVMPPNLTVVGGFFIGPNVNLSGEVLSGLNLSSRNLDGANLSTATITSCDLTGSTLGGANLASATITSSNLSATILAGANLTGASMTGSIVDLLNMTGANMGGLPVGATFGSDLRYASTSPTMTPPAGWAVHFTNTNPFSLRFNLLRQS